jgi:flagellar basal body rod protein FlgF
MITKRCWATGSGKGGVTGFVAGGMGRIDPDGTLTIAPGEVDGGAVTVIVLPPAEKLAMSETVLLTVISAAPLPSE